MNIARWISCAALVLLGACAAGTGTEEPAAPGAAVSAPAAAAPSPAAAPGEVAPTERPAEPDGRTCGSNVCLGTVLCCDDCGGGHLFCARQCPVC